VHRQFTTKYPSFLDLSSARLLDCQTGQTTFWVFLLGFSCPRSRTGLCAQTRILLFPHHGSLFHTTMLYLLYLFQHASRIGNHLHLIELRNQLADVMIVIQTLMANIGNLTQQVIHLMQNVALMQANQNLPCPAPISQPSPTFTPIPTSTTTISICTGPGPCSTHALFFPHQRTKDCDSPPLFWKKRQHRIFHQWMLLMHERPKIGIP